MLVFFFLIIDALFSKIIKSFKLELIRSKESNKKAKCPLEKVLGAYLHVLPMFKFENWHFR